MIPLTWPWVKGRRESAAKDMRVKEKLIEQLKGVRKADPGLDARLREYRERRREYEAARGGTDGRQAASQSEEAGRGTKRAYRV